MRTERDTGWVPAHRKRGKRACVVLLWRDPAKVRLSAFPFLFPFSSQDHETIGIEGATDQLQWEGFGTARLPSGFGPR